MSFVASREESHFWRQQLLLLAVTAFSRCFSSDKTVSVATISPRLDEQQGAQAEHAAGLRAKLKSAPPTVFSGTATDNEHWNTYAETTLSQVVAQFQQFFFRFSPAHCALQVLSL
jgi:hypothetical protein